MKFLKSGLPRPTKQELAQMVKQSETTTTTAYLVFVKFENKNTIYSLYYLEQSNPALFFIDNRLNITYVYYFDRDVWVIGQTGQQYTGDIEFDEIDSIVYSGFYSRRISQDNNFVFGCYLTSPKKIKLDLAEKYSELDFVVIPKLQNKIVRKNGSYKADENYAGINYITVEVPDSETVKLENLEITPTKEKQTFYPTTEYDGFNNVIVNAIPDSLIEPNYQTKTVTPNKNLQKVTYDSSEGYNALSEVFVEAVPTQTTPTFTENGTYYPQENLFFDKVKVNVFQLDTSDATATENEIFKDKSAYINGKKVTGSFTIDEELSEQNGLLEDIEELLKSKLAQNPAEGTIEITENGTHNVKNYEFADVNVQPVLQEKETIASETQQEITADNNYYGLSKVIIAPATLGTKAVSPTTNAQTITPDNSDYGLKEVNISAVTADIDKNISPTNIVKGINILGVTGEYEPLLEDKTVAPSQEEQIIKASSEYQGINQVIVAPARLQQKVVSPTKNLQTVTPDEGYYGLSEINLNAINLQDKIITPSKTKQIITADNNYDGLNTVTVNAVPTETKIITENGTFIPPEGYFYNLVEVNVPTNDDISNKQKITVIDYDGTIIEESYLEEGEIYTLPTPPTQSGLTFQKWACPIQIVNNQITIENYPVIIAPIYSSTTLKFQIVLNKVTGLSVSITNISASSLSWGDGSTAGSGSSFTHTYSSYGTYTITISGATTIGSYVFGQSSSAHNFYVKKIWISNNITSIDSHAFRYCETLETVTIPNSVTSIGTYAFGYCYNLKTAIIPSSVVSVLSYAFAYCYSGLEYAVLDYGLRNIQTNSFANSGKLHDFIMPNSVTVIGTYITTGCYNLNTFKFSTAFTEMPTSSPIGTCYNLEKAILKNTNVTLLPASFVSNARKLKEFIIPSNVTTINGSAFSNCYSLEEIQINVNKVTTINHLFSNCYALKRITLVGGKSVPTLSSATAFNSLNKQLKIVVSDLIYNEIIGATNWVNYANYIYKMSEV